ncbi:LysM peptidoglycan-binding domain-containing protein [Paenibacillus sp. HB172176]|uniref:LysM peptidoglycan-binding domain-containing protein n=1 Tax=Paenibacillus sp. HB172176 TaxID=2493690 RepID=UPI00143A60BF|nr:LysM peptidoglycan-binding domain-containing protein [Paenibacillus sp. HB172176]
MADYGIYLSFNNQEEGFQLPINPASIDMSDGSKGQSYDIPALGEINVIKARSLTQYSFNSLLPARDYPFTATPYLFEPRWYVDRILKWMDSKRPIRFVFTGESFDINEAVSIDSFDWKEASGSIGNIEYSLKLKKYVFYSARRIKQSATNGDLLVKASPARASDKKTPETYTVVAGDSLWSIAKRMLDNGARWTEIQALNKITDAGVKTLAIGTVLKLPGGS